MLELTCGVAIGGILLRVPAWLRGGLIQRMLQSRGTAIRELLIDPLLPLLQQLPKLQFLKLRSQLVLLFITDGHVTVKVLDRFNLSMKQLLFIQF